MKRIIKILTRIDNNLSQTMFTGYVYWGVCFLGIILGIIIGVLVRNLTG
jgi:hypothetical protein